MPATLLALGRRTGRRLPAAQSAARPSPLTDIDVLAHVLLAPFRAELYRHLVDGQPAGRERLLAAVRRLLDGL